MKFFLNFVFITLLLLICKTTESKQDSNAQLANIIEIYSLFEQSTYPLNHPEINNNSAKLPDISAVTLHQNHQELGNILQLLLDIKNEDLSEANQINASVLKYRIQNQLDSYIYKAHYMPLTAESGFHVWISRINKMVSFKNEHDYQNYLKRLAQLPTYFQQQTKWMRKGIKEGITQPKVVLEGFETSIKTYIKTDVTQSTYYQPFVKMPTVIDEKTKQLLRATASKLITKDIFPAYRNFYDFMVNEYQPQARDNIAATSLPNGKSFYDNRIAHYTTLNLSADEIHEIGLSEVKRIREEMESIIKQLEFSGSFAEFIEFLRTDEQFYAKTPNELLKEASFISKQMDAQLPKLFKNLPRTPYGVKAVPENIAPKYTTGRYSGPSRDDQPGYYWVNTYRLDRRPLYVLEALTLHEAVPGHHLQNSIAKEMKNVPKFRNNTYISAFGEGWGLYSEYLGLEAGFYKNPYNNFGRLTYEMWRASRLVVDTGMHSKGWSREKAITFLADNTALSLHNVTTEIDRYISWPAQALSYKIGELKIKKLRLKAENELGESFDLREFHDQILVNGSMPLNMLEKVINKYINGKLQN